MSEQIQIRIHGPASGPTLIYLPGLHGDWTLIGGFRLALPPHVRFVEMIYPRTLVWSLDDYAAGIEAALEANGVSTGWVLGESFGSQVVWALASRNRFRYEGLIFAGGFARYPLPWAASLADTVLGRTPRALLSVFTFAYATALHIRYRRGTEVRQRAREFLSRRTPSDLEAVRHRLRLIAQNNLCRGAREAKAPVFMLSGLWDVVVPWPPVRRWMQRNCPTLREFRILRQADHPVLMTAPKAAAKVIVGWMMHAQPFSQVATNP